MAAPAKKVATKKSPSAPRKRSTKTTPTPAEKQPKTVLVLRTCREDMTSHGGFVWPESGPACAPDWKPSSHCGNGLHGWKWGEGDGSLGYIDAPGAKWMVVEVQADQIIDIGGKVKFPRGTVVFCGEKDAAVNYMVERAPQGTLVIGQTITGGDGSTLTGGDRSTLTGGDDSTLTGGYGSTLTGGDRSTLTGGDESTLTGGDDSTLTGGDDSTLTGGDGSTLTGGDGSTLTGGYGSTLTSGEQGYLTLQWWDGKRYRYAAFDVGEDDRTGRGTIVLPGKKYRIEDITGHIREVSE